MTIPITPLYYIVVYTWILHNYYTIPALSVVTVKYTSKRFIAVM